MLTTLSPLRAKAARAVEAGNVSFVVNSVRSLSRTQTYWIEVPKPLNRGRVFSLSGSVSTKFGEALDFALYSTPGVVRLKFGVDALVIVVDPVIAGPAPQGFHELYKGLPHSICVAIEECILRNNGPIQRLADWIRRF